jgi:hypothetical protein
LHEQFELPITPTDPQAESWCAKIAERKQDATYPDLKK